jgi:hypothetical protein
MPAPVTLIRKCESIQPAANGGAHVPQREGRQLASDACRLSGTTDDAAVVRTLLGRTAGANSMFAPADLLDRPGITLNLKSR